MAAREVLEDDMRSFAVAALLAGVLIALAMPGRLDPTPRETPACRDWKREHEVACVAPLVKLGRRHDPSAYDARRRLCQGCRTIFERAAPGCPSRTASFELQCAQTG